MWQLRILFLKFWGICMSLVHTLFCQVNLDSWLQYLFCKILLSCVQILLWCSQISGEHHFPNPHMSFRSVTSFSSPSHPALRWADTFTPFLSFSTVSLQKHNTEWNKQLQKHSTVSVGLFLLRFQFWAHRCCWHVQLGGNTHHLKGRWSSAATCGHWTVLQQQCDHCLHAAVNISAAPPAATA